MTNKEKAAVKCVVERINRLASLENARFTMDDTKDKEIKTTIRPYMQWFESAATFLEALADAENKFDIQNAIDDIHRYCY